jgi:hypothetical protein
VRIGLNRINNWRVKMPGRNKEAPVNLIQGELSRGLFLESFVPFLQRLISGLEGFVALTAMTSFSRCARSLSSRA